TNMCGWKIDRARRLALWVLCISWVLWVGACAKRETHSRSEAILRISQRNEPATLDPQVAALPDEFFILRALSEGLVIPTASGAVQPAAAEKWETSADGLTWTFHLRPNAVWSNGDPVTARDFVYTIHRALTPALAAPKAPLFFVLKNAEAFYRGKIADSSSLGATAVDDRTLVLALEHPAPQLLALLASGPWLPVHETTVEKFGNTRTSDWTRPGNFVGNGPFVLADWQPNRRIVVHKNPRYRDTARVRLDGISFEAFDNGEAEERAFRAGQIDVTMAVPFSKLSTYAPPALNTLPLAETRYLALNVQRPPLDDPRVRRALALAIDRQVLTDAVLKGGQQPALSVIPLGLGGYLPLEGIGWSAAAAPAPAGGTQGAGSTDIDQAAALTEARRLLAEAGFPDGRGFPNLELTTWPVNLTQLEAVQQMWRRELGIEVTLVRRDLRVQQAALHAGDFTIGFMAVIPDYNDPAAAFGELVTGAANNFSHWSNARYDALVAEADRTPDAGRRLALYREAESVLLSELPLVPLYFNTQKFLLAPRVQGWRQDALWNRDYRDVFLKE
ncbi:MAG TPA: peptide ABC transporter substrate-binding protein, partial [Candidatus Didemnitutus sp.]|nr:peptide ABC transporter substrate-binding protein [Candidatus Didemnitutus sp.]